MTTTQSTGYDAFRAAVAARDVDALVTTLAPDVVLHSPITSAPFQGREVLADLYRSLFESLEELRVTDDFFANGDTHAFFWEGRANGRFIAGADRLRLDSNGLVSDITVVGRPLTGVGMFLTEVGYRFARRRRGGLVAKVLRLMSMPLVAQFAIVDPLTAWIIRGRSRS
jgi:hypothetical protein